MKQIQQKSSVATKAEHMLTLAIWRQTKQLEGAQGAYVWIKHDKMRGQLVPAAPVRAELQASIKAKRQMLQFLREGKVTQP